MIAFVDLHDARIDRLSACAVAWNALAERFRALAQRLGDELIRPLRASGWEGPAATAALGRLTTIESGFAALASQSRTLSAIIGHAATELRRLQRNLDGIIDAASTLGLRIDTHGRVRPRDGADALDTANARTYDELIAELLKRAARVDADVSAAIRDCEPARATTPERLPSVDAAAIPRSGDARAAARWWGSLSDDERHLYRAVYPESIGSLTGLPAAVRDEANRQALRESLHRLAGPSADRARRLLALLNEADAGPAARRPYLMDIDNDGDGRVVIALGDPDAAQHTAVFVPGVGADLDGIGGLLDRAGVIRDAAEARQPGDGQVAVVAWLGYDPPDADDIVAAPFGGRARDGAPALDTFIDGLRTTGGPPGHITVIGHSYGTAVIGEAASHGDGLAVDDIIAVGSPGLRVDHASALNVGAGRVWALAAPNDHIADPGRHAGWYLGALTTWAESLAHGPAPHEPAFGAHRLDAEANGHSGYWRSGSVSLTNQARIVTGDRPGTAP